MHRIFLFAVGWLVVAPVQAAGPRAPTAVAVSRDGRQVYVAETGPACVAVVDIVAGKRMQEVSVPGPPLALAVDDSGRLYVADGSSAGRVLLVDPAHGRLAGEAAVGHTPTALALSNDGQTLFVANRFSDDVSVIDTAVMKERARLPVGRQPVAMALTPNGALLAVVTHLPAGPADIGDSAAAVSLVSTADGKVQSVRLLNGATGVRGVCVSPDGKYAYVTHILARYLMPTSQLDRGWLNTSALSIIDLVERQLLACVLVDDLNRGAANPWAVACTADGRHLLVTHAGTHELSVIDRPGLHQKIEATVAAQSALAPAGAKANPTALRTPTAIEDDLSFLVGLRRRVPLGGNGPRALVIVGDRAVVAMHFSDSLAIVDIPSAAAAVRQPGVHVAPVQTLSLGSSVRMSPARRGEMLWNDASICFQSWQSCATCHPDGRSDGLNWDLLNDGLGNPRQTKSMLLAHQGSQVMITGVRESAETAVRAGLKFILFSQRPEEEARAIDEYLKSLQPVPSPYRLQGKLSTAALRGQAVFSKAGCAECHRGEYLTDQKKHDVGTGYAFEQDVPFVTPPLIEVWRTAPFLMDGRAGTMKDVLTKDNPGDRHGRTSGLSQQELNDLAEYVLSQ